MAARGLAARIAAGWIRQPARASALQDWTAQHGTQRGAERSARRVDLAQRTYGGADDHHQLRWTSSSGRWMCGTRVRGGVDRCGLEVLPGVRWTRGAVGGANLQAQRAGRGAIAAADLDTQFGAQLTQGTVAGADRPLDARPIRQ